MKRATLWLQLRRIAALALFLLLWEGISALGWVDPFYAPPPSAIGGAIAQLFTDGDIYKHLEATFGAALLGLFLGLAGGALLGFIAALARPVAELLEPVMAMLNAIPRVILAPLFIIWLGIGIASKVALSFILVVVLTFFAVYLLSLPYLKLIGAALLLGALSALSLGGYLMASWQTYRLGFPLDDAWIHCTIARNLAEGHGWSYNPGVPVQNSSGPLWTALVALGVFFMVVASIGVLRLGDFYQRLHAPTKAATLGLLASHPHLGDRGQRGAHGVRGVPWIRGRCPPHRHDRVADELVDVAAGGLDRVDDVAEILVGHAREHIGAHAAGERGDPMSSTATVWPAPRSPWLQRASAPIRKAAWEMSPDAAAWEAASASAARAPAVILPIAMAGQ